MRALITGGLGFIGSNIVHALNQRHAEIFVIDQLSKSNEYIADKNKFVKLINKDEFHDELLKELQIDVLFHQGAITDTTFHDEKEMMRVNFELSVSLYEQCRTNNVRMIYASSAAVYGLGEKGFKEEQECEAPLNVYGLSKLKFDNFIRSQSLKNQVVGLRYFNVYGQNENHKMKMASPLNQFFHQAMKDGEIKVFEGSENFHRDFISVDDVVDVNMFFLDNPNMSGIFNCGTGATATFQDAAKIVSNVTQKPIKTVQFPEILKGKYQAYTKSNTSKLKNVGYKKEFSNFENAATSYVMSML